MLNYQEFLHHVKSHSTPEECKNSPLPFALEIFQGKWKNHVLLEMCRHETVRFNQLRKFLPQITNTMLTTTLRELESSDLINRIQYNEIPPHVEYSLSEKGKDLMPIYYEIYKWSCKHHKWED